VSTFVGIDLGTTNTSIAVFDGRDVEVVKQVGGALGSGSETTPSAIFIDEKSAMHVGDRAYTQVALRPEDVARGWKRLLGSGSEIQFASAGVSHTPEWCSTELLKWVFNYLPEQLRDQDEMSVVITVPAAFGQVMNEATLKAARDAGLPNVSLLTEPVAACLAVMKKEPGDKKFLVYDLGGGTFDVSIADFTNGKGSIVAQGGIESSGGRDWDFMIVDKVIIPWILDNYKISVDDLNSNQVKNVLAMYAEMGKIELSQTYSNRKDENVSVQIRVPDGDIKVNKQRLKDSDGKEIGLDVELKKSHFDQIIENLISDTVNSCNTVMQDAGIDPKELQNIVFIGGPTLYKPLREAVEERLGLMPLKAFIDPMTAVARGASIHAESINVSTGGQKESVKQIDDSKFPLEVEYEARVGGDKAKVRFVKVNVDLPAVQVEVKNAVFSSGLFSVDFSKEISVPLNDLVNEFMVEATVKGKKKSQKIEITKVAAQVTKSAAQRTMFFKIMNSDQTKTVPEVLVKAAEELPKAGSFTVRSSKELTAKNKGEFISFKLFTGEILDQLDDNTFIGELKLEAESLGKLDKISAGDQLICEYAIDLGSTITMSISIPSIGQKIEGLYYSGEAVLNPTTDWNVFAEVARDLRTRLKRYLQSNPNRDLELELPRLDSAINTIETSLVEEQVKSASDVAKQISRKFYEARKNDKPKHLLAELEKEENHFENDFGGRVKSSAGTLELENYKTHSTKARKYALSQDEKGFREAMGELNDIYWGVCVRSSWWAKETLESNLTSSDPTIVNIAKQGLQSLKKDEHREAVECVFKIYRMSRVESGVARIPEVDIYGADSD